MPEKIKLTFEKSQLYLHFSNEKTQKKLLEAFKERGLDLIDYSERLKSYFKPYKASSDLGCFVSQEGRIGLIFPSEKLKFFFKESIGLSSEAFMDMGPGYETQLHFNENWLPYKDGSFLLLMACSKFNQHIENTSL